MSTARRRHPTDYAVPILLPFGALLLPVLGWVVGVVWLWQSSVWSRTQKLVGTFVLPGGCAAALFFNWQISDQATPGDMTGGFGEFVVTIVWLVALAAPLVTAGWLVVAMRRNA